MAHQAIDITDDAQRAAYLDGKANELIKICRQDSTLPEVSYMLIVSHKPVLIAKQLLHADTIKGKTEAQLEAYGFSPGAASALKHVFPSAGATTMGVSAGKTLVSSETFNDGMIKQQAAVQAAVQAALAEQEQRLVQRQQAALAEQKREILESLGGGVPTCKEALVRVFIFVVVATLGGVLDWRPWNKDSQQQFPWASFSGNLLKAAASIFVVLTSCRCVSKQWREKWYEQLHYIFKS